jgi:hypothetical protein
MHVHVRIIAWSAVIIIHLNRNVRSTGSSDYSGLNNARCNQVTRRMNSNGAHERSIDQAVYAETSKSLSMCRWDVSTVSRILKDKLALLDIILFRDAIRLSCTFIILFSWFSDCA